METTPRKMQEAQLTHTLTTQAMNAEGQAALTQQSAAANNRNSLLQTVARKYKVSPFRQFADIYKLKKGVNCLNPREYYDLEVYRPDLTPEQKRAFVGERGSFKLNAELSPPNVTQMRGFLSDKVAFTALLSQFGLRTTTTQAVFSANRSFGALTTLRTAEELRDWLQTSARFPLFGKLISGTQAIGSVSITHIVDGRAYLASGEIVPLDQLVTEIVAEKDTGFIFQDVVEQHPEISARANTQSVSTMRIVTVIEDGAPRVLYALWKIPGEKAMSDNFWQKGSMIGEVDTASGKVLSMRKGAGPDTEWPATHPATGADIVGATLPEWQSVVDLAVAAHQIFPINGILGWDVAIGPDGARIIECNENPHHGLYQLATARGILNDRFKPVFEKIKTANANYAAAFSAKTKAYVSGRARF
jgi:hypothetical protein